MFEKVNQIDPQELPIYKKGKEIYDLIDQICQVIENNELSLGKIKDDMLNTTRLLSIKVVDVECDRNFDSKIESAAIIRRAARELSFYIDSIKALGFENVEYLENVRPLIKEYRFLFNDWVISFGKWDNKNDPWELLRPSGSGPANIY